MRRSCRARAPRKKGRSRENTYPNPHKALNVKRQYFPFPGTVRLFGLGPGWTAAVAEVAPQRPGLAIGSWRGSWPRRPRTNRTQPTCGLRRPRSAEQGGCARSSVLAGPDTHRFPAPWPFKVRRAHLPEGEGPVRLGSRTGRVVRRFLLLRSAPAGVGGTRGWCFGTKPVYLRQRHADLVRPPTHRRGAARWWATADGQGGHGRRPIKASGCRGCGPGHPQRTRGPVTMGCHRWGWPRWLPLGLGSPAAPWLNVLRSAGHQRPP